jgi:hypothetical protein
LIYPRDSPKHLVLESGGLDDMFKALLLYPSFTDLLTAVCDCACNLGSDDEVLKRTLLTKYRTGVEIIVSFAWSPNSKRELMESTTSKHTARTCPYTVALRTRQSNG